MDISKDILNARRLQGAAAQIAASGLDKAAATARIKKYTKQASIRDAKREAIRKTILEGLPASA